MIKIENIEVFNWEGAIRGMRNPMDSWDKSDSGWKFVKDVAMECSEHFDYIIGPADLALMRKLCRAGSDHRKFLRQIMVSMDITAPLYWWPEFDTYKIGTVANSCSKMHTLLSKPFEMEDFSFDKLPGYDIDQRHLASGTDDIRTMLKKMRNGDSTSVAIAYYENGASGSNVVYVPLTKITNTVCGRVDLLGYNNLMYSFLVTVYYTTYPAVEEKIILRRIH